jgi:hypothetical protein
MFANAAKRRRLLACSNRRVVLLAVVIAVVLGLLAQPAARATLLDVLPSTPGKVTGGGFIVRNSEGGGGEATILITNGRGAGINNKGTFGFVVELDDVQSVPTGNLVYLDHGVDVRIKAVSFDKLMIAGCTASFTGEALVNGVKEHLTVDVLDSGEPGSQPVDEVDTFTIETDFYGASGPLIGGNIQVHDSPC